MTVSTRPLNEIEQDRKESRKALREVQNKIRKHKEAGEASRLLSSLPKSALDAPNVTMLEVTKNNSVTNCPIYDFPAKDYSTVVRIRPQGYHLTLSLNWCWGGLLVREPEVYLKDFKSLDEAGQKLWEMYLKRLKSLSMHKDADPAYLHHLHEQENILAQKVKDLKKEHVRAKRKP